MNMYERARAAAIALAPLTRSVKDKALLAMAIALEENTQKIIEANGVDVVDARLSGTAESTVDRLILTDARIRGMADGLRQIAGLPDPVGEVVRGGTLANGLQVRQIRVPFGVVGIIYEAR